VRPAVLTNEGARGRIAQPPGAAADPKLAERLHAYFKKATVSRSTD